MLESLFHKVADLQACNFIKKRLQHRCFSVAKFLQNTYFEEHLRTAASELTLRSECLEFCFGTVAFKTTLTYENTSHFQTRTLSTIRRVCWL